MDAAIDSTSVGGRAAAAAAAAAGALVCQPWEDEVSLAKKMKMRVSVRQHRCADVLSLIVQDTAHRALAVAVGCAYAAYASPLMDTSLCLNILANKNFWLRSRLRDWYLPSCAMTPKNSLA